MVGVLARSPRAAAASRGGSARPAWLGVAFILMRGLFWGGGGCPDTELRLLADEVMGGAVRGSTSLRAYKYTNDSFSTSIELRLAISYPGMLSDAAVRQCGCGKIFDVNTVGALPRVMWSSSTSSSTSSATSTSPCFSPSSPSSHLLQLLLVGSIRALACACGFGLWDIPRGAGCQARGGWQCTSDLPAHHHHRKRDTSAWAASRPASPQYRMPILGSDMSIILLFAVTVAP